MLPDANRFLKIEGEEIDVAKPSIGKEAYFWVGVDFLAQKVGQNFWFTTSDDKHDILLYASQGYEMTEDHNLTLLALAIEERYSKFKQKAQPVATGQRR